MDAFVDMSAIVPALFVAAPDPLITFYDDATGERTSLTPLELRSWVGRTASLLRSGCGLDVGAHAAVLLPPHWQTAAVLLGAWQAGVSVEFIGEATAGLPRLGAGAHAKVDVVFAAAHRIGNWIDDIPAAPHRYVVGGSADGYLDYLIEVRRHNDDVSVAHQPGDPATVDGTSYGAWARLAQAMAEALDLRAGDRVLVDAAAHEQPVTWLLAPLSVGASVVVCANLDESVLDERMRFERVTRVL
jgi:uncharacterized protein (TIGR03089 family)